jgi:outer membrane protein insertion porin family
MKVDNETWLWSSGLELRWRSPMGDLRVGCGVALSDNYDGNRKRGRFEFTMGSFF